MGESVRIVLCQCRHGRVFADSVGQQVRKRLGKWGGPFETVEDLCWLAGRRDPVLARWAEAGELRLAACFPRAVRGLFAAAGAPLDDGRVKLFNLRVQSADEVASGLIDGLDGAVAGEPVEHGPRDGWPAWFPVIDADRCNRCRQCLNFCLFGVYTARPDGAVEATHPSQCKNNCPACARICPQAAIIFPKYPAGPINGAEVTEDDLRRQGMGAGPDAGGIDLAAMLRKRAAMARPPAGAELDGQRALRERSACAGDSPEGQLPGPAAASPPAKPLLSLPVFDAVPPAARQILQAAHQRRQADSPAPPDSPANKVTDDRQP